MSRGASTASAAATAPAAGGEWGKVFSDLLTGGHLTRAQCHWAMAEIVGGRATDAQLAAFLVGLRAKGETADEVIGLVEAMLEASVPLPYEGAALDIVGTGGDRSHSVNISTLAAIVAAAAGAVVIKHGNRAASSTCGSADVLEELGVVIDLGPEGVLTCVDRVGIGFCFAPVFHPAMRYAGPVRKQLGVPTIFNILGPMANPAQPAASLIGASDATLAPLMAEVFSGRELQAMVVRGLDGLDEVTVGGPTDVWDDTDAGVRVARVDPGAAGIDRHDPALLVGGDAPANAAVVRSVLAGAGTDDADHRMAAVRAAVLLNAGLGLVVWDAAVGEGRYGSVLDEPADRLARAMPVAAEAIDSGRAGALLDSWIEVSSSA